MKRNAIRLATFIMLFTGFTAAQADVIDLSATDIPYDLGADPADGDAYSVLHARGSFNDVFRFTLSEAGDIAANSVSPSLPGLNGAPPDYLNTRQEIALFSDPDGDGTAGDNTRLLAVNYDGSNGVLLAKDLASGGYYFQLSGMAEGIHGGEYLFTAHTAPVPEPESYALLLAGLGLVGYVSRRRLQRSAAGCA